MAEAENGSYQRTWKTAYGKLTTRNPETNAIIEVRRKSEPWADIEKAMANKARNGRTEYVSQAMASKIGKPGFDHDDHQKSTRTKSAQKDFDESFGSEISRYLRARVPMENATAKSVRNTSFIPS